MTERVNRKQATHDAFNQGIAKAEIRGFLAGVASVVVGIAVIALLIANGIH